MNIVVCMKQVPDTETNVKIKADAPELDPEGVTFIVNPYDEFAIEEGLSLKERFGEGEVVLVCIGPEKAAEAIRTGLAMGVDRAVHLCDDAFIGSDASATAEILAKQLGTMEYDIILCGKQAMDMDNTQVPVQLAELLGLPQGHTVTKLEISDDKKTAVAHRQIEGGSEVLEMALPAVISCQKGINEPRYASLKGIMGAKKKPMEVKTAADVGIDASAVGKAGSKTRVVTMSYPPERPAGRVLEGEIPDVTKEVVQLLREERQVI